LIGNRGKKRVDLIAFFFEKEKSIKLINTYNASKMLNNMLGVPNQKKMSHAERQIADFLHGLKVRR
jgi:hypothetical protein